MTQELDVSDKLGFALMKRQLDAAKSAPKIVAIGTMASRGTYWNPEVIDPKNKEFQLKYEKTSEARAATKKAADVKPLTGLSVFGGRKWVDLSAGR